MEIIFQIALPLIIFSTIVFIADKVSANVISKDIYRKDSDEKEKVIDESDFSPEFIEEFNEWIDLISEIELSKSTNKMTDNFIHHCHCDLSDQYDREKRHRNNLNRDEFIKSYLAKMGIEYDKTIVEKYMKQEIKNKWPNTHSSNYSLN